MSFPKDAVHVALDLETSSTSSSAGIVQLSATSQIESAMHFFDAKISLISCEEAGLDIAVETMKWWDEQDKELRNRVFSGHLEIDEAIHRFVSWCLMLSEGDLNRIYLWGNGSDFDNVILRNACEKFQSWPFNFRNNRDMRTLMSLIPEDVYALFENEYSIHYPRHIKHDALHDSRRQHHLIRSALKYLGNS